MRRDAECMASRYKRRFVYCTPRKLDTSIRWKEGLQTRRQDGRKPRVDRTAKRKRQIVQEGLRSENVSETCRRHGMAPALFHHERYEAEQGRRRPQTVRFPERNATPVPRPPQSPSLRVLFHFVRPDEILEQARWPGIERESYRRRSRVRKGRPRRFPGASGRINSQQGDR